MKVFGQEEQMVPSTTSKSAYSVAISASYSSIQPVIAIAIATAIAIAFALAIAFVLSIVFLVKSDIQ